MFDYALFACEVLFAITIIVMAVKACMQTLPSRRMHEWETLVAYAILGALFWFAYHMFPDLARGYVKLGVTTTFILSSAALIFSYIVDRNDRRLDRAIRDYNNAG